MVTIYIDNRPYEVKEGQNLLHAALSLGIEIPYFCWHPCMGSVGACRQCAVVQHKDGNDPGGRVVMSCMTPVDQGGYFSVNHPQAKSFRRHVIEWLMTNHPHDCPVCDEGGECHLQDMTVMSGHNYRRYNFKKRTFKNQNLGPFVKHEMNRCITCYRCVRYYKGVAGGTDLDAYASSNHVYFGRPEDGKLESEFSGNLVEICPTGVFTDKTFNKHFNRKWDLRQAPSVCQLCSVGCNTIAAERYGAFRRIQNRYNQDVNGYFLCDKGRFGHGFANSEKRLKTPFVRIDGKLQEVSQEEALSVARQVLQASNRVIGIASPRASMEANFALKELVGAEHFYAGISDAEYTTQQAFLQLVQKHTIPIASLDEISHADGVVVIGEDITQTAPMMALRVRQAVWNQKVVAAKKKGIADWNDAAIRNSEREEQGNLAILTPLSTNLDDVARIVQRAGVKSLISALHDTQAQWVSLLTEAENPVLIVGCGLLSPELMKSALEMVAQLRQKGRGIKVACAFLDSNSVGLSLLQPRLLSEALKQSADVAIVLENDLTKRLDRHEIKQFRQNLKSVVALDYIETPTTQMADVVFPTASFFEGTGTLVNQEARAQRYERVVPIQPTLEDAFRVIQKLNSHGVTNTEDNVDVVNARLARALPLWAHFADKMLKADFRIHGQKIPKQPLSAGGRTAIHANVTMHEPQTPIDPDSPLSNSMEGYPGRPPAVMTPFYWRPGWNSVQALNQYQKEVGGPLQGGEVGTRLHIEVSGLNPEMPVHHDHRRIPIYHIFGSEERSVLTEEIASLVPQPYIVLAPQDAERLGVPEQSEVNVGHDAYHQKAVVKISPELEVGSMGVPVIDAMREILLMKEECRVWK